MSSASPACGAGGGVSPIYRTPRAAGPAAEVVVEYEQRVRLGEFVDPDEAEYAVGAYQPSDDTRKAFTHAGHPHYDLKSFNEPEREMARALDKFADYVWVRNKDRLDYGIPLPIRGNSFSRRRSERSCYRCQSRCGLRW